MIVEGLQEKERHPKETELLKELATANEQGEEDKLCCSSS